MKLLKMQSKNQIDSTDNSNANVIIYLIWIIDLI